MRPYFGLTGGWLTFWVTVACATDMTLYGYDQGVFGGVIVTDDFLDLLGIKDNISLQGTITAIYDIGCFAGAIIAIWAGEVLGRRRTVLVGTTIMTVGAILQFSAFGVPQMIVGRITAGIGNGLNTSTAPVWQSETSKASWRGKLVMVEMFCNVAGFSLSNWMTYGFSFVSGPISWRFPLAFQLVFIFILFGTVPWLPESPRWLIAHGHMEEAQNIIADLESLPRDDVYVATEVEEIAFAVQYEKDHAVGWWDLLCGRTGDEAGTGTTRRLLLGAGSQAMQQLTGINVTSYYLPTVLHVSVGLTQTMSRLLAACNSVSYLFFSFIAILNIEKWGRRRLLMYSAAGQCFCYLIITVCLRYSEMENYAHQTEVASVAVAFFFLYYVFYGTGWQGVPWLYATEINSLAMRTKGAALAAATNWICNFAVVEITPIGINSLGWKFYIIWTVLNASFVPIIFLFYPETADRTLEDIDRLFRENHELFVFGDPDAISSKRPQKYIEFENEIMGGIEQRRIGNGKGMGIGLGKTDHIENQGILGQNLPEDV